MDRKVKKDSHRAFNSRNLIATLRVFSDIGRTAFLVSHSYLHAIFLPFCVGDCDERTYLAYVSLLCSR